jgi:hypothetical protein
VCRQVGGVALDVEQVAVGGYIVCGDRAGRGGEVVHRIFPRSSERRSILGVASRLAIIRASSSTDEKNLAR